MAEIQQPEPLCGALVQQRAGIRVAAEQEQSPSISLDRPWPFLRNTHSKAAKERRVQRGVGLVSASRK